MVVNIVRNMLVFLIMLISYSCTDYKKSVKTQFDLYAEKNLSQLNWVSLDGKIIKSPDYSVDYIELPAFKDIHHIPDRKKAFFDYLRPAIEHQNELISERRAILVGIKIKLDADGMLSAEQKIYMKNMREQYRISEEQVLDEAVLLLLQRIDTLPVSMVLAQAAIESGWGTSRFVRQANNLFGHWCFTKGCGLVPLQRAKYLKHEVRRFSSIEKAIEAYFLNINSHPTYELTREIRYKMRSEESIPTGYALVAGLEKYSALGQQYIEDLRNLIRSNNLES